MTFGSLFSGIGGLDLGLERAGLTCRWQVEIKPFCRAVLAKHWPNVPRFEDVTKFCRRIYDCEPENEYGEVTCPRCGVEFGECACIGTDQLLDTCGPVDVVCGGFPCQDVSNAGHRAGIDGERSGLWAEFERILGQLQPRYAVVENVGALSVRGLQRILGGLSDCGYDAEWTTIPAAAFGAVHRRDRIFVVAYAPGDRLEGRLTAARISEVTTASLDNVRDWPALSEPIGIRTTDGVPDFVDRIEALGNAVVPAVAEYIGRRILEAAA